MSESHLTRTADVNQLTASQTPTASTALPTKATRWPRLSLAASCTALVATVVVAYLLIAPLAARVYGGMAWWSAGTAALVCGICATLALLISGLVRNPRSSVVAVLGGVLIRMGAPLAIGTYVTSHGGALADAGFFGMIFAFYLITLVVETLLSLSLVRDTAHVQEGVSRG